MSEVDEAAETNDDFLTDIFGEDHDDIALDESSDLKARTNADDADVDEDDELEDPDTQQHSVLPTALESTELAGQSEYMQDGDKAAELDEDDGDRAAEPDDDVLPENTYMQAERERISRLLKNFTTEQHNRYEAYRRSNLNRGMVKKIMQSVSSCQPNPHLLIVMTGITKVFVGEIVESARAIMAEMGQRGPLRPRHIREAYRRLRRKGLTGAHNCKSFNPILFKR